MGRHYRSRYRPPGYRTARLVLVPLIAAILAVLSLFTDTEDRSWSPTDAPASMAPETAPPTATNGRFPKPLPPRPSDVSLVPVPAPSVPIVTFTLSHTASPTTSSGGLTIEPFDQHRHRNFSARSDPIPESIQGCQRSAASCFESGGLGELTSNLQVMKIDPVTGRFCFSFQPECSR